MSIKQLRRIDEASTRTLSDYCYSHPIGMWRFALIMHDTEFEPSVWEGVAKIPKEKFSRLIDVLVHDQRYLDASAAFFQTNDSAHRRALAENVAKGLKDQIDDVVFWSGVVAFILAVTCLLLAIIGFLLVVLTLAGVAAIALAAATLIYAVVTFLLSGISVILSLISRTMPPDTFVLSDGLDMMGGKGGKPFYDDVTSVKRISGFTVSYDDRLQGFGLDAVLTDGSRRESFRGSHVGTTETKIFRDDETIKQIECGATDVVDTVTVFTNYTKYGPFGKARSKTKHLVPKFSDPIIGLIGRSGSMIDALGVMTDIYGSGLVGDGGIDVFGRVGTFFLDDWDEDTSPNANVSAVRIWSSGFRGLPYLVRGIQIVHRHADGQIHEEDVHGKPEGDLKVFDIDPGDFIVKVSGKYGKWVDSISVTTKNGRSCSWGGEGGHTPYEMLIPSDKRFIGFWGQYDDAIDNLGICVCPST